MLTNSEISKKYFEYLKESGVNTQIIKYLESKPYIITEKLRELIGEDLYPMYKDGHIETLKKGNETFGIGENGDLWWEDEHIVQGNSNYQSNIKIAGETYSFSHGQSMLDDPNVKKISKYYHISMDNEHIIQRELSIDDCQKDGEKYYNGSIKEQIFNDKLDLEEENSTSWEHSNTNTIPNNDLLTRRKIFGKGYSKDIITQTDTYDKNYAENPGWQYVFTGNTQGERIQSEINEITSKSNIVIDSVRNFFNRILNNTKDFEK